MSITDELREYAEEQIEWLNMPKVHYRKLLEIADRIDAEHEKQCAESWMRGHDAWAAIDRSDEMAEHGWIRLPVDADGKYVHIDDVMEWPDGETFEVVGIGDGVLFYFDGSSELTDWTGASTKRHHKPPTAEDVLTELTDEVWNRCCNGMTASDSGIHELVTEYAAKLQLKEDA